MRATIITVLLLLSTAHIALAQKRICDLPTASYSSSLYFEVSDCSTSQRLSASSLVPSTRTITCTAPLSCAGDLSADRTYSVSLTSLGGLTTTSGGLAFDYSQSLASSPALSSGACVFSSSGSGGLLCEGSAADGNELFITMVNPTADRTDTFPDASGTVLLFASNNHIIMPAGSAPTVACTGTGTSPAAPTIVTGSTDHFFTVIMNTGTLPSSSGTCTITFAQAYSTMAVPSCMLASGASAWGTMSTVLLTTDSLSAPVVTWTDVSGLALTSLTASSSYKIKCSVFGV